MPAGIKEDQISAEHKGAVLEVHVKKPEEVKPKKIQIGVSGSGAESHPTIEGSSTPAA